MTDRLKPDEMRECPLCCVLDASLDTEQIEETSWCGRITCDECDAVVSNNYTATSIAVAENEILATWNRRADPAVSPVAAIDIDALSPLITKLEAVIDHATGGKLSKQQWSIATICGAIDEHVTKCVNDALSECPATQQSISPVAVRYEMRLIGNKGSWSYCAAVEWADKRENFEYRALGVITDTAQSGPVGAMMDDEIQLLWDVACKDSPGKPGWSRHIRFARVILAHVAVSARSKL